MAYSIDPNAPWFHGSNLKLTTLRTGSTVTQWRELAEAFSHKPTLLCCEDNGSIFHNGIEHGFLYVVDEPVELDNTVYQHPQSTLEPGMEFLTRRELRLKLLCELSMGPAQA